MRDGAPARRWGGIFVKLAHDLVDDFARMRNNGDHDRTLIVLRLFERGELAIEQRRRHEMPVARRQASCDEVAVALQMHDADIAPLANQVVAIALEAEQAMAA